MRRFAVVLGAALPVLGVTGAWAENVVIRIEAKRGGDAAAQTATAWAAQFPDVVTFPAGDNWVAIALGPMPREQATGRLAELKQAGKVPGDSFIASAEGRDLTPAGAAPAPTATTDAAPADTAIPASAGSTFPQATATPAEPTQTLPADPVLNAPVAAADSAAPATQPDPAPAAPEQFFLRLESSADRAKAEEILAKWRQSLPEAGLWTLPNGRLAVGFGPMDEATGKAWLKAFRAAGAVPKDAFLAPGKDMGEITIIGARPELGAPPAADAAPVPMPPLQDIQSALRWAGHYDGAIDGKDGPMTQKAIAEEILRLRTSPDPASAMQELLRRREAWRAEAGLETLRDDHTGLELPAPMARLQFDRTERQLSIYGPKDGSGAALILFSQPGGQQEMLDLAGLVTALGWVPAPQRRVERGSITLDGRNQTHIGHAEGRVVNGMVQGFVLIWPAQDAESQRRIATEISDSLARFAPGNGTAPTAMIPAN
jgi:hypothetical protein